MPSIQEQVSRILQNRQAHLPRLKTIKEQCEGTTRNLAQAVAGVDHLLQKFSDDKQLNECGRGLMENLHGLEKTTAQLRKEAEDAVKRFSRQTINIGFGGSKGTGKSFLLQKLSGLTDNEVPSAEGMPVTAVRSVLRNSSDNNAIVRFHDEAGFLEKRVSPLFKALGLPSPLSLEEFGAAELSESNASDERQRKYVQDLKAWQQSITSWSGLLTGRQQTIELKDLRPYVAYTVLDENGNQKKSYVYLAVNYVEIRCEFPKAEARDLMLIDLPGLGELDPALNDRHTEGFANNVDACLFIRRPDGTRMDWDEQAQQTLETLKRSSPQAGRPEDFIQLVVNGGGCQDSNVDLMYNETKKRIGPEYTVICTRSSDSDGLSNDVLNIVLQQLAGRLEATDSAVCQEVENHQASLDSEITAFAKEAKKLLRRFSEVEDNEELIRHVAQRARKAFARLSQNTLMKLETNATADEDVPEIIDQLDGIKKSIDEFLQTGLGCGSREQWEKDNIDEVSLSLSAKDVLIDNVHTLRVKIANEFSHSLDTVYHGYVQQIQNDAVNALNAPEVMNGLLQAGTPEENLRQLMHYMENSELSLPDMQQAVDSLLSLRIEHKTQFYPRSYDPIRRLKKIIDDDEKLIGQTREEKLDSVFQTLQDAGLRTVQEIGNILAEETRSALYNILYVAYESFEDLIARGPNAEDEWIRFFKSYHQIIITAGGSDMRARLIALNQALKALDRLAVNHKEDL
ncbi:MAG: hypothetical protein Q3990_08455 [Desulfovibrionaceae bacterium]|nr:hypothetical protein [Desulfovibrionaceae bacterium]